MPIYHSISEEIGNRKCCIPDYIIIDQDSVFMPLLMYYLFKKLDIKIKTVAPYNHQSLQAKHGIKLLYMI